MILRVSILIFSVIQIASLDETRSSCITPDQLSGDCVSLSSCEVLLKIIQKKPLREEHKLFLQKSQCGYKENKPLVCCPSHGIVPKVSNLTTNNLLPVPGGKECGFFSEDRIFVSQDYIDIDGHPWTVLLEYTHSNGNTAFRCNGVLINKNYVLTSSNCVNGKDLSNEWTLTGVRLGEWDISTEKDCIENLDSDCADPPINVRIDKIIPHENYDSQSREHYNDIALLRLAENVNFNDFVKPICLPTMQFVRTKTHMGQRMAVVGWKVNENSEMINRKFKSIITGVDFSECSNSYKEKDVIVKNTQLCGNRSTDENSCHGYLGSVLTSFENDPNSGRPYFAAVGISSFGPPCDLAGFPNVYTKVSEYIPWILQNVVE